MIFSYGQDVALFIVFGFLNLSQQSRKFCKRFEPSVDSAQTSCRNLVLNISVIVLLSFYQRSTHILGYCFMLYLRIESVRTLLPPPFSLRLGLALHFLHTHPSQHNSLRKVRNELNSNGLTLKYILCFFGISKK